MGFRQRTSLMQRPLGRVDLGASEHLKTSRMGGQEGLNGLRPCEREAEAVFILENQGNVEKHKKEKLI